MPLTREKRRELRSQRALDEQWASLRDWAERLPREERVAFDDFLRRMEEHTGNGPTMQSVYVLARVAWMEMKFRRDGHVEGV